MFSSRENNEDRDYKTLVVDALKAGIRFQRCVAEAWLKVPVNHVELSNQITG